MLTFNDHFHSDDIPGCILWADEPAMERVCFNINSKILQVVLHGENPVHHDANVAVCEKERPQIEAACRRAFASRPSAYIDLLAADFNQ